jgi:hypothetical protein
VTQEASKQGQAFNVVYEKFVQKRHNVGISASHIDREQVHFLITAWL